LEIIYFFEELPLLVASKVVSKELVIIEGYMLVSMHTKYRDIVKFKMENKNSFKRLVRDLIR
jgi:hypothetical protein